jgi:hypothetical protein
MDATIRCVCPPRADGQPRHDTDTITFRDRLDFRAGAAINWQIFLEKQDDPHMSAGETLAVLSELYLVHGVESWTLVDAKNKPIEPTHSAIRTFMSEHYFEAMEVKETADAAYSQQVLLPLLQGASTSSQPSPTPEPTSPSPESSASTSKRASRKRSSRSSTSTTQTDDTGTITSLHGGDSRSARNSATAA